MSHLRGGLIVPPFEVSVKPGPAQGVPIFDAFAKKQSIEWRMVAFIKKNLETPPMTYNIAGDDYAALEIE
jgi:hypothetical protein